MKRLFILFALVLFVAAACSPAVAEQASPATQPSNSEEAIIDESMAGDETAMTAEGDEAMVDVTPDHSMASDSDGTMQEPDTPKATVDAMADGDMADDAMASEAMADEAMADEAMADEAMADEAMADDAMADNAMAETAVFPAWGQIALTNAQTGETFKLADFAGKTVFVEPMATWCTNCRQQLNNVSAARASLSSDEVVFVALSVETTISNEELAAYAKDAGFDWVFAVMTPELLQELADSFGRTVANPPSTPHFIIGPDGSVTELVTGIKSPEEIAAAVGG